MTTAVRSLTTIVALVATGLVLAACGSDNDTGPSDAQVKEAAGTTTQAATTTQATTTEATTTTTQAAAADGKAIFTANCSSCHTLADAGASGAVGPNLDDLKPDEARVVAIVSAGRGGMPSFDGQLSPAEIKAVSTYVSSSAG